MTTANVLTPLEECLRGVETHVAAAGWDAPVRLFALVRTARAMEGDPALAAMLDEATRAAAVADPEHLLAIEQDDLPAADRIEELLRAIEFGSHIDGVALSVERIVIPPEAERDLPENDRLALDALAAHPERRDVRLVVGVLRNGAKACAIRQREHDDPQLVSYGEDLVPGLTSALAETLVDDAASTSHGS